MSKYDRSRMQYDVVEMADWPRQPLDRSAYPRTRSPSPTPAYDNNPTEFEKKYNSEEHVFGLKTGNTLPLDQYQTHSEPHRAGWWARIRLTRDLWSTSWNMYLLCAVGIAFAIGHHAFYASLEGKIVAAHSDDQILMLRYGTVLAFAAKASLVAAVLTALKQQIWATVRSKFLGITTLDDMFAASEMPFSLLNMEFLNNAKVVAGLALYGWISPLIVILTTNTLVVVPTQEVQNTTCPGVRSLNFAHEDNNEFRNPEKINGSYQWSLSLWNTTGLNMSDPDFFDYWHGPSNQIDEVLTAATTLKRPLPNFEDTFTVCEKGWNCVAEVIFVGPSYKCQETARGVDAKDRGLKLQQESGEAFPPFDYDTLAPTGNYTYRANAFEGDYFHQQMKDISAAGIIEKPPPWPESLGAFRTEPILWVGYSEISDPSLPPFLEGGKINPEAWQPTLLACEHYETEYTVELGYIDGVQIHQIKNRIMLGPVVNTTFLRGVNSSDGTMDETTAIPEENYVLPRDKDKYRRAAAYHSLGYLMRKKLNGTIQQPNYITDTEAIQTRLFGPNFDPLPNLIDEIPLYYETLLLSLFFTPRFLSVVWAADPSIMTGSSDGHKYLYPCIRERPAVKYYYRARVLVPVYGIAVLLALLGVAAGTIALRKNGGISRNTRFSSVLAATRAKCLNGVAWNGPEKDHGQISQDSMQQKLGYGLLSDHGNDVSEYESTAATEKYGFGFEGEVQQLSKNRHLQNEEAS